MCCAERAANPMHAVGAPESARFARAREGLQYSLGKKMTSFWSQSVISGNGKSVNEMA